MGTTSPIAPTDLLVLPRLNHARTCGCFVCTADLAIEDYRAERAKADSEEWGDEEEIEEPAYIPFWAPRWTEAA